MKNLYKNEKGMTLVELLLVLGLLGLITGIVYSMYFFGTKTFTKSSDQTNIQQNVRIVSDYITREVRYAKKLEIIEGVPNSFLEDTNYIFLDEHRIKHKSPEGETNFDGIEYTLEFHKSKNNILKFTVEGIYKDRNYSISSEVFILNLGKQPIVDENGVGAKRSGIVYIKEE